MSRVREFFVQEAGECLAAARTALERDRSPGSLYGAVRRFRGSAQMARYGELARAALGLEHRLHQATGPLDDATRQEADRVLAELERGVDAARAGRLTQDPKREEGMAEYTEETGATGDPAEIVPIEALEYAGVAALERAETLRQPLEDAMVADEPVGPILDELFDLIRLGRS